MTEIKLNPQDRVLLILNDYVISEDDRLQRYGFLLSKKSQKELKKLKGLNFYDDWKPSPFGPHSEQLASDITNCIELGLLDKKTEGKTNCIELGLLDKKTKGKTSQYHLALKGRVRWRKIFFDKTDEIIKIKDSIRDWQKIPQVYLFKQIWDAYPEYVHSIKCHT